MLVRSSVWVAMCLCFLSACGAASTPSPAKGGAGSPAAGKKDAGSAAGAGDAGLDAAKARPDGAAATSLRLESTAFMDGSKIASQYRCMAPSPDLRWSGAPSTTLSYAVVLEDVTMGFSMGFLHWVIYDIGKDASSLTEGVSIGAIPAEVADAKQAAIWNGTLGFNGPCGPSGTNTYELTLYAEDVTTLPGVSMSTASADIVTAIKAHALASAKLTVTSSP
ncbi:MAG: YbhB/YbcL family Raf kinase inhibitor-like protein [Polyangiales bacterium]